MCDMNEEEYAEYLLWLEAAVAKESGRAARVRKASVREGTDAPVLASVEGYA